MREIKFRVWDVISKAMIGGETIESATNPDESSVYHTGLSYGDLFVGRYDHKGDWYELPIMQFTGLSDKNGRDIYEGDILKYSLYVDHGQWGETVPGGTVQVTWLQERAGFYPFYVWSSYDDQFKTCEVIGNIYENPELIK